MITVQLGQCGNQSKLNDLNEYFGKWVSNERENNRFFLLTFVNIYILKTPKLLTHIVYTLLIFNYRISIYSIMWRNQTFTKVNLPH